jgi:hypothetical protein
MKVKVPVKVKAKARANLAFPPPAPPPPRDVRARLPQTAHPTALRPSLAAGAGGHGRCCRGPRRPQEPRRGADRSGAAGARTCPLVPRRPQVSAGARQVRPGAAARQGPPRRASWPPNSGQGRKVAPQRTRSLSPHRPCNSSLCVPRSPSVACLPLDPMATGLSSRSGCGNRAERWEAPERRRGWLNACVLASASSGQGIPRPDPTSRAARTPVRR